jgi:hypothetical protein
MMDEYNMISDRSSKFPFYGITFGNQSFFVLVGTFSTDDSIDFDWSRHFFRNRTLGKHGKKFFFNHQKQISDFLAHYPNRHIIFRIVTISFRAYSNATSHRTFDLPIATNGHFFEGKSIRLAINGREFDFFEYSREVSIFAVLMGFFMLLTLQAWRSLSTFLSLPSRVQFISSTTLAISFIYDLVFHSMLFLMTDSCFTSSRLSLFLFLSQITISAVVQMPVIHFVVKEQNLLRGLSTSLFYKAPFFIALLFAPLGSRFVYWFCPVFFSLGQWLPQIFKNLRSNQKSGVSAHFVVSVSFQRVLAIWYLTFYSANIFEKQNPRVAFWSTLFIACQAVFLLLQRSFGPFFFMPGAKRPRPFNYGGKLPSVGDFCPVCRNTIDEPEKGATTPCAHTFHMECIAAALAVKLECPLCRRVIPPIEEK